MDKVTPTFMEFKVSHFYVFVYSLCFSLETLNMDKTVCEMLVCGLAIVLRVSHVHLVHDGASYVKAYA